MNPGEMKQRTKLFALELFNSWNHFPKNEQQKCLVDNCCDQGLQ